MGSYIYLDLILLAGHSERCSNCNYVLR